MSRKSLLIVAVATIATAALSADLIVTKGNVATFYREFTRLTKEPQVVSPLIATLCTLSPNRVQAGPHEGALVHYYANSVALPTRSSNMTRFTVGSVIVKEKLGEDRKVTGVGGMIKHEPGYDPENGDWEYFYSGEGKFGSGRIASCADCHRKAKDTDFVYTVWSLR
jgi:hypothetical protein